jgi:hypothetical protein
MGRTLGSRNWSDEEVEIAGGLHALGLAYTEIAEQLGRSPSSVCTRLRPGALEHKRARSLHYRTIMTPEQKEKSRADAAARRKDDREKTGGPARTVVDADGGGYPYMPKALTAHIEEVVSTMGGSPGDGGDVRVAMVQVYDDHADPWFCHPCLNPARGLRFARAFAASWKARNGLTERSFSPQSSKRAERGISVMTCERLDGSISTSFRASVYFGGTSRKISLPTIEMARGWRKLALKAAMEGKDPRTIPFGPMAWERLRLEGEQAPTL